MNLVRSRVPFSTIFSLLKPSTTQDHLCPHAHGSKRSHTIRSSPMHDSSTTTSVLYPIWPWLLVLVQFSIAGRFWLLLLDWRKVWLWARLLVHSSIGIIPPNLTLILWYRGGCKSLGAFVITLFRGALLIIPTTIVDPFRSSDASLGSYRRWRRCYIR